MAAGLFQRGGGRDVALPHEDGDQGQQRRAFPPSAGIVQQSVRRGDAAGAHVQRGRDEGVRWRGGAVGGADPPFRGERPTEITTSSLSHSFDARSIISKCPFVGGSKDPANTAFVIIYLLTYLTKCRNRCNIVI